MRRGGPGSLQPGLEINSLEIDPVLPVPSGTDFGMPKSLALVVAAGLLPIPNPWVRDKPLAANPARTLSSLAFRAHRSLRLNTWEKTMTDLELYGGKRRVSKYGGEGKQKPTRWVRLPSVGGFKLYRGWHAPACNNRSAVLQMRERSLSAIAVLCGQADDKEVSERSETPG